VEYLIKFADEILSYRLPPQATIYGRDGCEESLRLREWAVFSGLDVEYLTLDVDYDLMEYVTVAPHARKFPSIVVDGETIGDCNDFMTWLYFMGSDRDDKG